MSEPTDRLSPTQDFYAIEEVLPELPDLDLPGRVTSALDRRRATEYGSTERVS